MEGTLLAAGRVLVVEDDRELLELLLRGLREEGLRATGALTGQFGESETALAAAALGTLGGPAAEVGAHALIGVLEALEQRRAAATTAHWRRRWSMQARGRVSRIRRLLARPSARLRGRRRRAGGSQARAPSRSTRRRTAGRPSRAGSARRRR